MSEQPTAGGEERITVPAEDLAAWYIRKAQDAERELAIMSIHAARLANEVSASAREVAALRAANADLQARLDRPAPAAAAPGRGEKVSR